IVGPREVAGGMAGPGVLAGATGGYVWAHVPGAYIVGLVAGSRRELSAARAVTAAAAGGIVAVYVLGVWQLGAVTGMDWRAAPAPGGPPLLAGDAPNARARAVVGRRLTAALGRGTFRRNAAAQEPHPRTAKGFGHDFPRR